MNDCPQFLEKESGGAHRGGEERREAIIKPIFLSS
jgi:hypothetical protein